MRLDTGEDIHATSALRTSSERPRYTFEIHCSRHQTAHEEILKATGTAMSGRDKVRKFLKTIQCTKMEAAVATVHAQANLWTNFDEAINYLRDYIPKPQSERRNISGLSRGNGTPNPPTSRIRGGGTPQRRLKVEDHFYKPNE